MLFGQVEQQKDYSFLTHHRKIRSTLGVVRPVRWEVRMANKASWKSFCNTITSDTPTAILWNQVRKLQNPFTLKSQPFLMPNLILSDPVSKVAALADHFEQVLSSPYPNFVVLPLALALSTDLQTSLNSSFTLYELETCLTSLKIPPQVWIVYTAKTFLFSLLNINHGC
jgi:hypothetical protein